MANLHSKRCYRVEIDGITRARFATCSELSAEYGLNTYNEGGNPLTLKQLNGKVNYPNVTLERGILDGDRDFESWCRLAYNPETNTVGRADDVKRNVSIVQEDTDGSVLKRWDLIDAFPVKWVASAGWDANAEGDITMESLELAILKFI